MLSKIEQEDLVARVGRLINSWHQYRNCPMPDQKAYWLDIYQGTIKKLDADYPKLHKKAFDGKGHRHAPDPKEVRKGSSYKHERNSL